MRILDASPSEVRSYMAWQLQHNMNWGKWAAVNRLVDGCNDIILYQYCFLAASRRHTTLAPFQLVTYHPTYLTLHNVKKEVGI